MLSTTMKGAVGCEFGKPLTIEEMPVKRPGKNEILVKVNASEGCHTNLHAANNTGLATLCERQQNGAITFKI